MDERIDYKKINTSRARLYLEGKNIVFTGRGFLVRGELSRLARQAGGNVEGLVSKRTDVLIVGEKPGSKLRKAKMLGCEIITTEDFKQMMYGTFVKKEEDNKEDYSIYNINRVEDEGHYLESMIREKKVVVLIDSQILLDKIYKKIDEFNGEILDVEDIEKVDLIVYEPKNKNNEYIIKAKNNNIEIMTIGQFNRLSM